MTDAFVTATAMTRFGKHLDRSMKDLGAEAVERALADVGLGPGDVQAVYFANSLAGLITGQECIRGEVVLYPLGFGTIPIHNVENACASGGNALHLAHMAVASGMYDTVLAVGVEKANHEDRARTFAAYKAGTDVEDMFEVGEGAGTDRTPLVDRQARLAQALFDNAGMTRRGLAEIAAKAYEYGRLNPLAHRRIDVDADGVLAARTVVDPITSLMSSPVSDGAAAAVVSSKPGAGPKVRIGASVLASRPPKGVDGPSAARTATSRAYELAGIGPDDIDVAEVHDASVAYEAMAWTETGLCAPGDEERWAIERHTALGGPMPINPSGGLIARGHALAASGIAQVHELRSQLLGTAGARQVPDARIALAQVGGGVIDWHTAVSTAHVLELVS